MLYIWMLYLESKFLFYRVGPENPASEILFKVSYLLLHKKA